MIEGTTKIRIGN